ncbi:MAG: class I SAM-dependent methyltransferase [Burkholderiales bacterium]|nr:class I SAM-dependent methyltransferase [Burkholderiales bacterium]
MSNAAGGLTATEWLASSPGQYVIVREQAYFDEAVADIFGYHALQLGLEQVDLLRASRIPLRVHAGPQGAVGLRTDFRDLPIDSNSVDLMVLPHTLEFSENPHQVVREVARVLRPEGHVVISGFNPLSLWGLRRSASAHDDFPWNGRFIHLARVKDWFALVGLEIVAGSMACYAPPCTEQKWLDRFAFMEKAGDRWWPIAGGVFFLQAIKRVRGIRLIMPKWSDRAAPQKNLAPVPERVRDEEGMAAKVRAE